MDWSPQSFDIIPEESLWSFVKRMVYDKDGQFGNKDGF